MVKFSVYLNRLVCIMDELTHTELFHQDQRCLTFSLSTLHRNFFLIDSLLKKHKKQATTNKQTNKKKKKKKKQTATNVVLKFGAERVN